MMDKKGLAAMLAAGAKKESGPEEGAEVDGKDLAVEDLMRAFDERDPEMMKAALAAFIEHCD